MLTRSSQQDDTPDVETFSVAVHPHRDKVVVAGALTGRLALLDAVPALGDAIPAQDRELASRVLHVPVRHIECGTLELPARTGSDRPFAVIVVSGIVLRETHLDGRAVAELLGPLDVIDTHEEDDAYLLPSRTEYVVRQPTTIALLDDRFVMAARRWPTLHEVLGAQRARQVRRATRQLAMMGLSRVEDRVTALFCDLADRWGRVTPEGIRIDMPLTHALIGELIGARRPTVTLALAQLAADKTLTRDGNQSWLLAHQLATAA